MSDSFSEPRLRNYDPETDFPYVVSLLEETGLSTEYCSQDQLERWSIIQPDSIIIATVDEEVIGSAFFQDGIIPYVYRVAVRKQYQRRGIGTVLLQEAERRAVAAGHNTLELNVGEDHPELVDFYEARGYRVRSTLTDMTKKL